MRIHEFERDYLSRDQFEKSYSSTLTQCFKGIKKYSARPREERERKKRDPFNSLKSLFAAGTN